MAVCKKYYAQKDKYGFPIPGTMEGFHKPYPSLKRGLFELKNFEYTPTPCECREYHPEGLRFFVKVDKNGNIIANSLFAARKKPLGVHTIEQIVYCEKFSCVIIPMKNFLNIDTPGYPVGVWNITGTYLGTATDQDAYVTLWNSDVTNQAQGTLFAGPTSTEFYITDTPNLTISFVRGLRYYRYTGPAGLEIFVGFNDIIRYGSTTRIAATQATAVQSDTRLEWNRVLWTPNYNIKIPNTTVYVLTCTGNPDSTPIFVFHNEDTLYVGTKFFPPNGGIYSFSGALPLATRGTSLRTAFTVNYNDINNWSELTSLWSICNFSAGGGIWVQNDPAFWPTTINSSQITQAKAGQSSSGTGISVAAPYMTYANYPNVSEFIFDSFSNYVGQEAWFLTMPKVNRFLYVQANTAATTTIADTIWNNIATSLIGIVPVVGSQARLRVTNTTSVSAASLTSRTYLAAQGWTIQLN